jgi:hypothetical protein
MEKCILFGKNCPNRVCEEVLDDGTPIMAPRCAFPYWKQSSPDTPPEIKDFENYCFNYKTK